MTFNALILSVFNFLKIEHCHGVHHQPHNQVFGRNGQNRLFKKNAKRLFALILSCFLVVYGFLLYHSEKPIYNGEMILLGWRLIVSG